MTDSKVLATRNKEDTQSLILAAAMLAFAERGFSGARIESIVLRPGSNKRMLYYYCQNKEALFLSIMEETRSKIREAESKLHLFDLQSVKAIKASIAFIWDYLATLPP